jgi:hypothetical protein
MSFQDLVVRVDKRTTRALDAAADSAAFSSIKVGGASGTEITGTNVATKDNSVALTNKTIDATLNTISNIANTNIAAAAAIAESKLNLAFSTSSLDARITAMATGSRFREFCKVITSDAAPVDGTVMTGGVPSVLPFGDDNAPQLVIGDFAAGDYLLFAYDTTPKLLKVYDDAGTLKVTSVGVTQPTEGDCYNIGANLPAGSDAFEKNAVYTKTATVMIKIADFTWAGANGISLPSWTSGAGTVTVSDNVLTALQKIDGNITAHAGSTSNPHSVTKTQVGLGNVDNVQQLPMSYLDTDIALAANSDSKVASQKAVKAYADAHINSTSNPHSVTKTQVGLGNVDNVQQLPMSYLDTDIALAANSDSKVASQKAVKAYADAHINSTSNPHSVTKTQVGLANVDNVQQLPMSYLDTDVALAANSDVKVASQKAIKTYVDGAFTGLELRTYTPASWANGSGTQAVKGNVGYVHTDGTVKPAGAGVAGIYAKRIVICYDATIDNGTPGKWIALPTISVGAASAIGTVVVGNEVYLSSTVGNATQDINSITAGHAIIFLGYGTAAADWEFMKPEYVTNA